MDENNVIISLQHVSKVFDKTFTAVDDVNLDIKKGEFVTLLGPSGCGKTTTLRMIAGFDIPTSGKIYLNGKDITNLPPYQRPVNTVFQHYALFPNLDVYDNVAFGLKLKKIPYEVTDSKGNKKTKYLVPTEKGTSLITVMPEQIQSASMTAEWEQKLLEVEKQDIASEDFMAEIKDMIVDLIETYEPVKGADKLFPPRQYKQYKKYPKKGASRWQR